MTTTYALQMIPSVVKSTNTLSAHDRTVAVQKRVSPKTQINTNGTITGKRKRSQYASEYDAMLRKELNYRRWHYDNLSQTITRNHADFDNTEQQLRAMVQDIKQEYDSSLHELFGHDLIEKQTVHDIIRLEVHSTPNEKSDAMIKTEKVLNAGRRALAGLAPNHSFNQWRCEMDEFETLQIEERTKIGLLSLRNLVEVAKVNQNGLLLKLQIMAEQYHQTFGILREEFILWRRRVRELQNMGRNGNHVHSLWEEMEKEINGKEWEGNIYGMQ